MIKHLKTIVAAVIISATAFTAQAQTNLVASLTFHLIGNKQGPQTETKTTVTQTIKSLSLGNSDLIGLLGTSTGNAFSSSAQLLRVIPILDGTNGSPTLIIKDVVSGKKGKTNIVDVTGFFTDTVLTGTILTNTTASKGALDSETALAIRGFSLVDNTNYPALTVHFGLIGSAISTLDKITLKDGLVVYGDNSTWTVVGNGNDGSAPVVLGSTITGGTSTLTVKTLGVFVGPGYAAPVSVD